MPTSLVAPTDPERIYPWKKTRRSHAWFNRASVALARQGLLRFDVVVTVFS